VLKKGTAGAATGNCKSLKGNSWCSYRKLQVLKKGTAGRQPEAYFTYRKWVWRILGQETAVA
jgi:hypothetical protein